MGRYSFAAGMVITLILAGCSPIPQPSQEDAMLIGAYRDTDHSANREPAVLAASHGRAIRTADTLTLALAGSKKLTLRSEPRGCSGDDDQPIDLCDIFVLEADLPSRHFYLVGEDFYEGANHFLIDDRTGLKIKLDAVPIFSPDGKYFLVQDDNVAYDHENNLEIWRRTDDGAVLEWAHSTDQANIEVPNITLYHTEVTSWRDDRINLTFSFGPGYNSEMKQIAPPQQWAGTITRENGKWRFEADWPKFK